ncbi:predicted protein [Sclerotinia sclerotiorum 1980 UF-70]|uniref:Uncharacterized protein n=1 Tax=Sclerotinia sclerotiorum (strain ATCC 18683 / 1980 / Ss-1) TaxID=665079 RepID=A7EDP2_SCLS1|nr:predicted protein [Sclerotinia sclerotiorum 1980 UF-70]EDO00958.1 predicted protein [Sclerotinia sclerotiorum 1980 UF-70]
MGMLTRFGAKGRYEVMTYEDIEDGPRLQFLPPSEISFG